MAGSEIIFGRKLFWQRGEPWVWITGGALALMLLLLTALLGVVIIRGSQTFWLRDLVQFGTTNGESILGEIVANETRKDTGTRRLQIKTGNRDITGRDFLWLPEEDIVARKMPKDAILLERMEYGNFYGFLKDIELTSVAGVSGSLAEQALGAMDQMEEKRAELGALQDQLTRLDREIKERQVALKRAEPEAFIDIPSHKISDRNIVTWESEFTAAVERLSALENQIKTNTITVVTANGETLVIPLLHVVRLSHPNTANLFDKLVYYGHRIAELLTEEPRESNTEGGLFPAIFGTVMLIFIMALLSFPLGVLAGVYLREYAKDGLFVRTVRIAVNNLAGIPSIVYGIFGLGFFVYGIGSTVDTIFFADHLPEPTFGTGGILWASLTLGILTIPVVIVSVEEALGSIPASVRQSSLSLGATKLQTLLRIILPMASPGIMTGFILAMARAAGEVAPLMITGVVKLAATLPVDSQFPFLHLERKFMHLGFHIYDISSQSPNVEAAKPMVYVTTLLLLLIVLTMSGLAIWLRGRMKKTYSMGAI